MSEGEDLEMLIIDGTIVDSKHKIKAIYPYKEGGTFSCRTLALDMSSRPKEEKELAEVAMTGRYNGLGIGLLMFERDEGIATGTSFAVTPPMLDHKGLTLTTEHNINTGRQHQMAIAKSNTDYSLIEESEWAPVRVVTQGTDLQFSGIASDYSTPKPSPGKGDQRIMRLEEEEDEDEAKPEEGAAEGDSDAGNDAYRTPVPRGPRPRERRTKPRRPFHADEEDGAKFQQQLEAAENDAEDDRQAEERREFREARELQLQDREMAARAVALTMTPSSVIRVRDTPDAALLEHTWTKELLSKDPTWYVFDPTEVTCADWDPQRGWLGGTTVCGIGNPRQTADEGYFRDVYGLPSDAAAAYEHAAKKIYRPNLKGVSPGKVIAQSATAMVVTCSFVRGSSGTGIGQTGTPLAAVAMHVRQKAAGVGQHRNPSNVAIKTNAPWMVLMYAKYVVPRLYTQLGEKSWPRGHEDYMRKAVVGYLEKHRLLIEEHDLWGPCYRLLEKHFSDFEAGE